MPVRSTARAFFAVLGLLASFSIAGAGDSPARLFEEVARVDVVNVEVYVTDGGSPVEGLTIGDFLLFEDGKPVEIGYFSIVDEAGSATVSSPGFAITESPQGESKVGRYVVYVDSLFLGPARRERLFSEIWTTFEGSLRPEDEVMVVRYDGSLEILLPLSTNRAKLRAALKEAAELNGSQMAVRQVDRHGMELIRDFQRYEGSGSGDCLSVGQLARDYADQMEGRVHQSIDTMTAFVNSLGGVPGRKTILHVSDGIPLVAGGEAWEYAIELCDGTAAVQGISEGRDAVAMDPLTDRFNPRFARLEVASYDTTSEWEKLAANANVNNVTIYPVQASGLDTFTLPGDVRTTQKTASFEHRNRQDSLVVIAGQTGGRAILNTNDFGPDLEAMVLDSRRYYLLGFEPPAARPGSRHRIRVEVVRPGVRVRHRESYQTKSLDERTADSVLTALLHGYGDNPLALDLSFVRERLGSGVFGRPVARLRVPFEGLVLLPQGQSRHGLVSVFVTVRNLYSGEIEAIRQASLPLNIPAQGAQDAFVYEVALPLSVEGRFDVAVAVRDNLGGVTSFARRQLKVGG